MYVLNHISVLIGLTFNLKLSNPGSSKIIFNNFAKFLKNAIRTFLGIMFPRNYAIRNKGHGEIS